MVLYFDAMNEQNTPDTDTPAAPGRGPDWLPRWELFALALGDLLALIVFAAIGGTSHGTLSGDSSVLNVLNTAMPFLAAWLVVGMLLGLYRGRALYPLWRVIVLTLLAGVIAGPLGVALRAAWLRRPILMPFVLVGTAFSTLALVIWRVLWSRIRRLWWPELP